MKKLLVLLVAVLLLASCGRKANQEYLKAAKAALDNYSAAVGALDVRIEAYQNDHALLHDSTWAAESLRVLGDLKTAGDALRNLPEASSALAELDRLLKLIADETDAYVDTMTTSINNLDESGVDVARSHRETIGKYMDDAQKELNRLLGSQ
ncbi:MAG: hypothetical protein AB1750_10350 [Chloroflexota bacterium]